MPASPWPGQEPDRLERERIPLRQRFAFALGLRRDQGDDPDPYAAEPLAPWERELLEHGIDVGQSPEQLREQEAYLARLARSVASEMGPRPFVEEDDAFWTPPLDGRLVEDELRPASAPGLEPAAGPVPLEPLTRARFRPATGALAAPHLTPGLSPDAELDRLQEWIWRDQQRTAQLVTAASTALGERIAVAFPHRPHSTPQALAMAACRLAVAEQVRRSRGRRPAGALALEARRTAAGSPSAQAADAAATWSESRELVSA